MARNSFLLVGNLEQSPSVMTLDLNASFPFYRGSRPTLYTSQEMVSGLPTRIIRKGVYGVRELTEVSACNLPREGCMPSGRVGPPMARTSSFLGLLPITRGSFTCCPQRAAPPHN